MSKTKFSTSKLLKNQLQYYKARADEYDDWFLRKGKYDRGEKLNMLWLNEVDEVKDALKKNSPNGKVLEIAAGTGWWTGELLKYSQDITALDAVSETLRINKKKFAKKGVSYVCEDIFSWNPKEKYDFIFSAFWISHIPEDLFDEFWRKIASALKPGGKIFFLDNARSESKKETNHDVTISKRSVKSGESFIIIKVFYKPFIL